MTDNNNFSRPFLGFVSEENSLLAAQELAATKGWGDDAVIAGDITDAIKNLKKLGSPEFLLVEIPNADEASELLDALADVCYPGVKVIVSSNINEFSFFSWLMEIGVFNYLLQPFSSESLEIALSKQDSSTSQEDASQKDAKTISIIGARGGVGTTTIATNLAYVLAEVNKRKTAILDIDAHSGTSSIAFDLESGVGIKGLFEHPERIDELFLDRIMVKYSSNLSILSSEEAFKYDISDSADITEALIKETKSAFSYVIADIPRVMTPMTRAFLTLSDYIVVVVEPTLTSMRDLLRITDYLKEIGKPQPIVVRNKVGLEPKYEIAKADFDKHYGHETDFEVNYLSEAAAAVAEGKMLAGMINDNTKLSGIYDMAGYIAKLNGDILTPQANGKSSPGSLLSKFLKK